MAPATARAAPGTALRTAAFLPGGRVPQRRLRHLQRASGRAGMVLGRITVRPNRALDHGRRPAGGLRARDTAEPPADRALVPHAPPADLAGPHYDWLSARPGDLSGARRPLSAVWPGATGVACGCGRHPGRVRLHIAALPALVSTPAQARSAHLRSRRHPPVYPLPAGGLRRAR